MKKLSQMTQKEQDALSLNEWLDALEDCGKDEIKLGDGFAEPLTDEEIQERIKNIKTNPINLKLECDQLEITISELIEFTGTPRQTLKDWSITKPKRIKAFLDAVKLNKAKIMRYKASKFNTDNFGIF